MTAPSPAALNKLGEQAFQRGELINAELFALTYGALVRQLLLDFEEPDEVNTQLERLGYNIGTRLVDDFLARSGAPPCERFLDTSEVIARVAFRMYLGVPAVIANVAETSTQGGGGGAAAVEYSIVFDDNPLADFVELPDHLQGKVWFSNVLCGVVRGALEMVQYVVACRFVRDTLRGDATNEIRVSLREALAEHAPADDEDGS